MNQRILRGLRGGEVGRQLAVVVAIAAASVLPYLSTLRDPFLNWDDYALILGNPFTTKVSWHNLVQIFTPGSWGAFQPVRDLTYMLDHAIAGYDPRVYHIGNLVYYAATNLAAYVLVRALGAGRLAALFAALVFALHPVHVEAVAWLSARKESVAGVFFLLSAALYIGARRGPAGGRRRRYAGALACALLAMLAKPVAVALPAALALIELVVLRPPRGSARGRVVLATLPFVVMAAVLTVVTVQVSAGGETIKSLPGGGYRTVVLTWPLSTVSHLRLLVWPAQLSTRYANIYLTSWADPRFVLSIAILAGVAAIVWRLRRVWPAGFLAAGWFFVTLLPVSNIVPISTLVADRYVFLPSFALAIVAAPLVETLARRRRAVRLAAAAAGLALLCLLAATASERAAVWHDNLSLWGNVIAVEPDNTLGRYAFANVQAEAGNVERAIVEYQRALQQQPRATIILVALAQAYALTGRPEAAERYYRRSIALDGTDAEARAGLADALTVRQQWTAALAAYDSAVTVGAPRERVLVGRARAEFGLERYDDTVRDLKEVMQEAAVARRPDTYLLLGRAHLALDRAEEALIALEVARRGAPEPRADIQAAIAEALFALGKEEEARVVLAATLERHGESPGVLATLGRFAERARNPAEAIEWYRAALEADSSAAGVWTALGESYESQGRFAAAGSAYAEAARRDPSGRSAINLGAFQIQAGRLADADSTLRGAQRKLGDDPHLLYNLACLEARLGRLDRALACLDGAARGGFPGVDLLLADPDLADVRAVAGFDSVVARVRANAAPPPAAPPVAP